MDVCFKADNLQSIIFPTFYQFPVCKWNKLTHVNPQILVRNQPELTCLLYDSEPFCTIPSVDDFDNNTIFSFNDQQRQILWSLNRLQIVFHLFQSAVNVLIKLFILFLTTLSTLIIQLLNNIFINHKTEIFVLFVIIVLLAELVRRRMIYWFKLNIPFESLNSCLRQYYQLNPIPIDDVDRVGKFGKIFGSFKLIKPLLCVADHRLADQILNIQSDHFAIQNTWHVEGRLLTESIFSNNSPADIHRWKRKKAILLSSFMSRKIRLLKPTIDKLVVELCQYLRLKVNRKQSRWTPKLDDLLFPWLTYSMLLLIFDIDVPKYHVFLEQYSMKSNLLDATKRFIAINQWLSQSLLATIFPRLVHLTPLYLMSRPSRDQIKKVIDDAINYRIDNGLLGLSEYGSKRSSKKCVKFRDQVYNSLIMDGKTESSNNKVDQKSAQRTKLNELTFIDIILNYEIEPEDKLEGNELSRTEMLDNLMAFFTVSVSTLNHTIAFVLYYLACYSNEQSKVRQEMIDYIGTRDNVNWEHLRNLKYMDAFINEVLRLHSPIKRIEREVTKQIRLECNNKEYILKPGMLCTILIDAIHYDSDLYPEPNNFNPSRFYNSDMDQSLKNETSMNGAKFIPFGLGSRTCIGLKFAMFYIKHLIANLLFDFELQTKQKVTTHMKRAMSKHIANTRICFVRRVE